MSLIAKTAAGDEVSVRCDEQGSLLSGNALSEYTMVDADAASPGYYGYLTADGRWYIKKEVQAGDLTSFTFFRGATSYTTQWIARAGLGFDRFDKIF
jgi:hypothetical protein